jgi:hypothetical protein
MIMIAKMRKLSSIDSSLWRLARGKYKGEFNVVAKRKARTYERSPHYFFCVLAGILAMIIVVSIITDLVNIENEKPGFASGATERREIADPYGLLLDTP